MKIKCQIAAMEPTASNFTVGGLIPVLRAWIISKFV